MSDRLRHGATTGLLLAVLTVQVGCGSGLKATRFTNPRFDFNFVQRVAVLPFENLSADQQAGFRATRLMITELLASGAVDVVEPGEVQAALGKLVGRVARPDTEQMLALGTELGVQAVVAGTVAQSEVLRSGRVGVPVVTLDVQMVETETGAIVWSATHTEKGSSFASRLLGTGGKPISDTTRRCVRSVLSTLIE